MEHDFNLKGFPPPETSETLARERQEELIRRSREKYGAARAEVEAFLVREEAEVVEPTPRPSTEATKRAIVERKPPAKQDEEKTGGELKIPDREKKQESQHRYLQALIKKIAEEKGFRATLEEPTPDGQGRVDVSLEREGLRIACEISLTTTEEQELHNILKCLTAGYDRVLVCSPDRKTLEKIQGFAQQKLSQEQQMRVLFHQPEDLFAFLEEEAARREAKEERVKGYRVKLNYQAVKEPEKKMKREAVAQVIVKAMRRMKEE